MVDRIRPPGLGEAAFDRALNAFSRVTGAEWVFSSEEDREPYYDLYPLGDAEEHDPSAAIAPANVEEVQAVVRLANEHRTPLWPISRGKNLGYGGAAPRLAGSIVLDLGRMNRILEVNERYAYCVLEPGVGFFDLYEHLAQHRIPLWMSVPGHGWGSVVGHALDRGNGSPFGEHAERICGLEAVLPDGDLVHTGMGAMSNSRAGPLFRHGFGPSWDQMFTQSNFGVVTKMGFWLAPAPEASLSLRMPLPAMEDAAWAIDALRPLRLSGLISSPPTIGNYLRDLAARFQRAEVYRGAGAMPEAVVSELLRSLNIGWWTLRMRFYGHEEVNAARARIVREAFARKTAGPFEEQVWRRGDPIAASGAGIPGTQALQLANWRGGRGAHATFSPVLPPDGAAAVAHQRRVLSRFREHGMDYYGGFTVHERALIHTSGIIYDRDDKAMTASARALFETLIREAAADGYGEYRTHISVMDQVARSFDFNDNALLRLNEKVKDALDPNGIIAPGKQGIWPKAYRSARK